MSRISWSPVGRIRPSGSLPPRPKRSRRHAAHSWRSREDTVVITHHGRHRHSDVRAPIGRRALSLTPAPVVASPVRRLLSRHTGMIPLAAAVGASVGGFSATRHRRTAHPRRLALTWVGASDSRPPDPTCLRSQTRPRRSRSRSPYSGAIPTARDIELVNELLGLGEPPPRSFAIELQRKALG